MGKVQRRGPIFILQTSGVARYLILRPGGFYFSNYAPAPSPGPDSFCMLLRKLFSNRWLEGIEQVNGDRIIRLRFRETGLCLVAELFGRGNLVVTDSAGIIQHALVFRSWRSRDIRKGLAYVPPAFTDWLSMDREQLLQLVTPAHSQGPAEVSRLLGLGKVVEQVWDSDPAKLVDLLLKLASTPLTMAEVEETFKASDSTELPPTPAGEAHASQLKALETSLAESRATIQAYRREAEFLRATASQIFMHLQETDRRLAEARAEGKKKLKVTPHNSSGEAQK